MPQSSSWLMRFKAIHRLVVAIGIATIGFLLQPQSFHLSTRILVSWDLAALVYLAFAWLIIARADAAMTRRRTLSQDPSGYVIFLLVVSAACASVVAIALMMAPMKELAFWPKAWHLSL